MAEFDQGTVLPREMNQVTSVLQIVRRFQCLFLFGSCGVEDDWGRHARKEADQAICLVEVFICEDNCEAFGASMRASENSDKLVPVPIDDR